MLHSELHQIIDPHGESDRAIGHGTGDLQRPCFLNEAIPGALHHIKIQNLDKGAFIRCGESLAEALQVRRIGRDHPEVR